MLYLGSGYRRGGFCDQILRRQFMGVCAAAGLESLLHLAPPARAADEPIRLNGKKVIVVYLAGGAPHMDSLEPKPEADVGMRGEFKAIETAVPGILLADQLPRLAEQMTRISLVHGVQGPEDEHEAALCQGGYSAAKVRSAGHPCMGAVVSAYCARAYPSVPPSVFMGRSPREKAHRPWVIPGWTGYLGTGHGEFGVYGADTSTLELPVGLDEVRLGKRRELLGQLDGLARLAEHDATLLGQSALWDQGFDFYLSPRFREALDYRREAPEIVERYQVGSTEPIGDGPCACGLDLLVALRLMQVGAQYIFLPFGRWDWHAGCFAFARSLMPVFDQAVAALIEDIHARGLQDEILVVAMGEFGRTPKVNKDAGRDHWLAAMSVLLSGGGLKMGQMIGATDRNGAKPLHGPISLHSVLATIYHVMGFDVSKMQVVDLEGRPHYLFEHKAPLIGKLL